ncbi:MAG: Stp1/IreP family PP2C-type Ser/Thr phosphatase [Actinomycetota bacterium]|nr:Stp1/IreP family PP2C-type Ser/Thr phosphatase [Actinomycetota bacterium]
MSAIKLRAAERSDVGRAREINEDAVFTGTHIFAVADGLGGHRAGEIASQLALEPLKMLDGGADGSTAEALVQAVRDANRAVYEHAEQEQDMRGMASTITALSIDDSTAHLAHVGDSRCYLIRDGAITQLSQDHTLVARMVQEGKLTPQQAESHPQRSIVTRALGAGVDVDVDTLELELLGGDRLVLCSDGLTAVLSDEELREFATSTYDLDVVCRQLVEEANARGGPDNITVLVIDVTGPRAASPAVPPPVSQKPAGTPAQKPRKRRRIPARAIVWLVVLFVISVGLSLGVRGWVNNSWYVGLDGETVAIYQGLPTDTLGGRLHHVKEPTGLRLDDVAPFYRPRLDEGLRVADLAAAHTLVARIPRSNASPTPQPTTTLTPRPSGAAT